MNFDNKDSFFHRILNVLEQYNFSETTITNENCMEKDSVLRSVTAYWRESLVRDAQCKTKLKFLAYENILLGEVHPVWDSAENSLIDVITRILTGTCLLQANIHRFTDSVSIARVQPADIRITCPCDLYPFTPRFYIVKLGCTGVYILVIFSIKHRLWVLIRTASMRRF